MPRFLFLILFCSLCSSCSNPLGSTDEAEEVEVIETPTTNSVTLSPAHITLFAGESHAFVASGVPPYFFFSSTGIGSTPRIDSLTGVYNSLPSYTEVIDTVRVFDSVGATTTSTVSIIRPTCDENSHNKISYLIPRQDGSTIAVTYGNPTIVSKIQGDGSAFELSRLLNFSASDQGAGHKPLLDVGGGIHLLSGFAATGIEASIFRSTDSGVSWSKVFSYPTSMSSHVVGGLVSLSGGGIVAYLLEKYVDDWTDEFQVYRILISNDQGATWISHTTHFSGMPMKGPVLSKNGKIFFLSGDAFINRLYSSTDGLNYSIESFPGAPSVFGVSLSGLDGPLFATTSNGLYSMESNAGTWAKISNTSAAVGVVRVSNGDLFGLGLDPMSGLIRSADGGNVWHVVQSQSSSDYSNIIYNGTDTLFYLLRNGLSGQYKTCRLRVLK